MYLITNFCILMSCYSTNKQENLVAFNKQAAKDFSSDTLIEKSKHLSNFSKCVIREVILNALDSVCDPEVTIFFPYHIRHYYIEEIDFNFSFFSNSKNQFQIACQPLLSSLERDYDSLYSEGADGLFYLRQSLRLIPLQLINLSDYTSHNFKKYSIRDRVKKIREVSRMVSFLYKPYLNYPVNLDDFDILISDLESSNKIDASSVEFIRRSRNSNQYLFFVFFSTNLGHILIRYDLDDIDKAQAMFLPVTKKVHAIISDSPKRFTSCKW